VPVAVVVRRDPTLSAAELHARCRSELAGFKQPRQIHFVAAGDLPCNATGKVLRPELEAWVAELPRARG
jgi:fatty-acyl-CoA synthase